MSAALAAESRNLEPGLRILAIDIETSPNLAHVWGLWNVNVSLAQLRESTELLCFAAKWLGDDEVMFHRGEAMVEAAYGLLDAADVVVHWNGRRFDVPHLNREFLQAGYTPPAPFRQIDLMETVKKRFRFPSNKLDYVSRVLGLAGKVAHEGHELWVKCMAGDPEAWVTMEAYNRQDVTLLEDLYRELLPWIPGHPHRQLYGGTGRCPACSGSDVRSAGSAYTQVSKFAQYRCADCGTWLRGTKRVSGVEVTGAVL